MFSHTRYKVVSVMVDIKRPGFDYEDIAQFDNLDLEGEKVVVKKKRIFSKIILGVVGFFIAGILSVAILLVSNFDTMSARAREQGSDIVKNIVISAELLKDLNPSEAEEQLRENQNKIEEIERLFKKTGGDVFLGSIGNIIPWASDILKTVTSVSEFNISLIKLTEHIGEVKERGGKYFQEDGGALIRELSSIQNISTQLITTVAELQNTTARLESLSSSFGDISDKIRDEYLTYTTQFHLWNDALENIIAFLDSVEDRRILLIFQNNSEMRPSGGFIGSYGVLTIRKGQMAELEVQDIYWPDHSINFKRKIVPPTPLQFVTEDWGARDANWFFDFPESAKTVMNFLESSNIYKENKTKFDGVIAINTRVLQSLLGLVGPIKIPEYGITIGETNFLAELQREVETGRDKQAGENPKKILSTLAPTLINRVSNLSEDKSSELFETIRGHIDHKDIMIYMRDYEISNLAQNAGVDGSVFALPNPFWGGYLAVVNANIAGGKSDAFIKEDIRARVDISTDGGSFTDLSITRTHWGDKEEDWWYKADNKNYIQIYAHPDSTIVSLEGNTARKKPITIDYESEGYETNKKLKEIEDSSIFLGEFNAWTMKAFGKSVFSTWFNTPSGSKKTLTVRYVTPSPNKFSVNEGEVYKLVFDRQSGVNTSLELIVTAPVGFVWEESGEPSYTFKSNNPKAREIIDLHLLEN